MGHLSNITIRDEWGTPHDVYRMACDWAGFMPRLDVAASDTMHVCEWFITREMDALTKQWNDLDWWCNPPYSNVADWITYAAEQTTEHRTRGIMLTYAKTDTRWFHDLVYGKHEILFLRGRIRFLKPDGTRGGPAPYPSMLIKMTPEGPPQ